MSLDGKTLCGSTDVQLPGVHLLAAYAHEADVVLRQLPVDAKTNEHKAALELLGVLPLRGKVVSGDARFTHRDFCDEVIDVHLDAFGLQPLSNAAKLLLIFSVDLRPEDLMRGFAEEVPALLGAVRVLKLDRVKGVSDFRRQQVAVLIAHIRWSALEMDVHPTTLLEAIGICQSGIFIA